MSTAVLLMNNETIEIDGVVIEGMPMAVYSAESRAEVFRYASDWPGRKGIFDYKAGDQHRPLDEVDSPS